MNIDELLAEIEVTREKLNKMGEIKSLVDAEVIIMSQRLDQLFNVYEKITKNKKDG